jgi:hypothetical protein
MEEVINFKDPSFFEEINYLMMHRLHAKLAYDGVLEILFDNLSFNQIHNTDIELLLNFGKDVFDEELIQKHSVTYLEKVGEKSKAVLSVIERLRFELRLLDNDGFEIDYVTLARFMEFIVHSHEKLMEIELVYQDQLKHLMN